MGRSVRIAALVAAFGAALIPGAARADYPPAGEDSFASRAQVFITPQPGCLNEGDPLVADEVLEGPTTVRRGAPVTPPDGRTEIPTELVSMTLTGPTVTIREDPDRASTGLVKQLDAGLDFPADSFFDVFVEVELIAIPGVVFENLAPAHMTSRIWSLPPHVLPYLPPPGTCIPLAVEGTQVPVLWLIHAEHLPQTERLCAIGPVYGVAADHSTGDRGLVSGTATIDVVRGSGDAAAADVVEFRLDAVWQWPRGQVRLTAEEPMRTGSPGTFVGPEVPLQSFFDVFVDVNLDGIPFGRAHMPLDGTYSPDPGTFTLELTEPASAGTFMIEWMQIGPAHTAPCATPYPPTDEPG